MYRMRSRCGLAAGLLAGLLTGFAAPAAQAMDCACAPCDLDRDGDVDLEDFGLLQACLSGFGIPQNAPACAIARLDADQDVDQQDVAILRNCMSGAGNSYAGSDLPLALINEFLASNDSGLEDEDGDRPDWIEIHNPCQSLLDLGGWYLTDDPGDPQKWQFPTTLLGRNQYLIVFASDKDRRTSGQPLHTNFKLNKDGGYLGLIGPDGQTVMHAFGHSYPIQNRDTSYGLGQISFTPVAARSPVRYHVPNPQDEVLGEAWTEVDFSDGGWSSGLSGLGFNSSPTDFEVKVYRANISVTNLALAESVLSDPAKQASLTTARVPLINLRNTGDPGRYGGDTPFPGMDFSTDQDNFVILATATVVIPQTGEWTFGVNSSEGFGLRLTKGSITFESSYPDRRAVSDTMKVFNVTQAGVYSLRLIFFEHTGDASVELFAAKGYRSSFDETAFRLVGDAAGGGLVLGTMGVDIVTDLGPAMRGVNSSCWFRIPFMLDDPSIFTSMKLRMAYEDGFVAYMNGQVIARRNAPMAVTWQSASLTNRLSQAVEELDVSGFHSNLRPGKNVLAIHGLNDAPDEPDFQILPQLTLSTNTLQPQYFAVPTPGAANAPGMQGFLQPVAFSPEHGFQTQPFQLTLSTSSDSAMIRYTLDGSEPTATTGYVYTGPFQVASTSVIRASAFRDNYISPMSTTQTYFFVNDIIRQSPYGQAPGPNWPIGSVSGQVLDYGMDPDIVNSGRYGQLVDDALLAIPSLSIVTEVKHLFDPVTGIYTHAGADGRDWERPISLELINPDGSPGFQTGAGLRIRGGYSRSGSNPKHSFRLFFRSEYGNGKLNFPLFGAEGVDTFDHVDLRTGQNYCWSFNGDGRMTLTRDVFSRDTQLAMGQMSTRSRFYHLYLNGQYWGIYMTEERPEADFAASYLGGRPEDYDVVKVEAGPYTTYATDGDTAAWYRLFQACQAGLSGNAAYFKVQGLNPDGTPNLDYEPLVDVDNVIDMNLVTFYGGDLDGPISVFINGNNGTNNFYVLRDRTGRHGGFKCIKHDAEHTLLNVNEDRTGPYPATESDFARFNPQALHQRLAANAEYRMRFADRVQKFFFNGGALTPEACIARHKARSDSIYLAIIAESARWGDAKVSTPFNRDDHWLPTVNWITGNFFPGRGNVVVQQLRNDGLYPSLGAPVFSQFGGNVPPGYLLGISRPAGTSGTIYYTTDGSDPRLIGGAVSPAARVANPAVTGYTLIARNSQWRFLDNGSNQGTAWFAPGYNDSASPWKTGTGQIGWGDGDEGTTIPSSSRSHKTYYFRKTFQLPAGATCTNLVAGLLRDDGGAVYLNGQTPPVSSNMPAGWDYASPNNYLSTADSCIGSPAESTYYSLPLDSSALVPGDNLLAVEIHQCASSASDLSFDLTLTADLQFDPVIIDQNVLVKARIHNNGQWSALVEAPFIVSPVSLVINEFMAANSSTVEDPDEPGEYPDWIELYNPGPQEIPLGGMYITDDPANPTKFRFLEGLTIRAGEYLVLWADEDGSQGNRHLNFKLSNEGEQILLYASDGVTVIDQITFGELPSNVSYGRYPDGGATWGRMSVSTPGSTNAPHQ